MPISDPYSDIVRLLTGYRISQAIHVAATLGLADLLKDGPRAADALATATNTDPRILYRLLRALAAAGVFREETEKQFSLAPMGEGPSVRCSKLGRSVRSIHRTAVCLAGVGTSPA